VAAPSQRQLERHIRQHAAKTENVGFIRHAKSRMRERHVSLGMVYEVLQKGTIDKTPEPDERYADWTRCRMRRLVAGMDLIVVVAVSVPRPDLLVVTVIDIQGS